MVIPKNSFGLSDVAFALNSDLRYFLGLLSGGNEAEKVSH